MEEADKRDAKQEQIQDIIFSREIGWQEIIYDLINTEQLDPWDVDIILLTDKYFKKIKELEEADFFISSKVLLAASLLLRIKSEVLINKHLKSIDEILFGKEEKKKYVLERIELEEEIPLLIPKSPIPRFKKVTLKDLIESLNKAIVTENRRIRKEIVNKNALIESSFSLPKRKFSLKNKIKEIYESILNNFKTNESKKKIGFNEFVGIKREDRIDSFFPLLHLEDQKKIWLEQEKHFEEIYIWLREDYLKENPDFFTDLRKELEKNSESSLEEPFDFEESELHKPSSEENKQEI